MTAQPTGSGSCEEVAGEDDVANGAVTDLATTAHDETGQAPDGGVDHAGVGVGGSAAADGQVHSGCRRAGELAEAR